MIIKLIGGLVVILIMMFMIIGLCVGVVLWAFSYWLLFDFKKINGVKHGSKE